MELTHRRLSLALRRESLADLQASTVSLDEGMATNPTGNTNIFAGDKSEEAVSETG